MRFELTKDFLGIVRNQIEARDASWLMANVLELHYADIAEIVDKLSNDEAKYIYFLVDEDTQADILMELEEEVRDRFIASLSTKQIADQLEKLDSDDAADILGEFSKAQIQEVISQMEDEAAEDIVDLLNYDENTAGGLMQKEFFQAHVDWPVKRALVELRKQAADVEKVYNIFVVNSMDQLVGVLSLKRILFAGPNATIEDLYQFKNIIFVKTIDSVEEVADVMEKYDLVSVPVVDYQKKLVGRITLDDVVDYIKDGADSDFQFATGISEPLEKDASIWKISGRRLPWLIIGLIGGGFGAQVLSGFEGGITKLPALAFFIPLITAMGGNVGVQASAIVVQSLARGNKLLDGAVKRILKETLIGLLNGILLSTILFCFALVFGDTKLGMVVSISLLTVIVFASTIGTIIPLVLYKYKIDPAIATGPFITTLNDVVGLFIYFTIGMLIYGI